LANSLTSREIVRRCLRFENPPRIAFKLPSPWPSDVRGVSRGPAPNRRPTGWRAAGRFTERVDEWGNTWRRLGTFTKGEVARGAVEDDWSLLDTYDWPDVSAPEIWRAAQEKCRAYHAEGYYVLGGVAWPFNIARKMRRMENFLCDLVTDRGNVLRLLDGVADVVEREIAGYAEAGVDGISTAEDWGTQDRLLVNPATWREVFKPIFRRLCHAAHAHGLDVWLHSCGHVTEVLDDWAEVGIGACMFDQPELHGIDHLAERYRGRLAFCCPVDIQRTLQTRDPAAIEAAARYYVQRLGADGGFIADYYGDNESLGLTPEYQAAACRAFVRYGDPDNLLGLSEDLR